MTLLSPKPYYSTIDDRRHPDPAIHTYQFPTHLCTIYPPPQSLVRLLRPDSDLGEGVDQNTRDKVNESALCALRNISSAVESHRDLYVTPPPAPCHPETPLLAIPPPCHPATPPPAIRHLPPAICHPSSAIRHPPPTNCQLSLTTHLLQVHHGFATLHGAQRVAPP